MKIKVEVPDGEYCENCIFKEIPQAFIVKCRLLNHKHLSSNPYIEKRSGQNLWVEHVIKDSECPSIHSEENENE